MHAQNAFRFMHAREDMQQGSGVDPPTLLLCVIYWRRLRLLLLRWRQLLRVVRARVSGPSGCMLRVLVCCCGCCSAVLRLLQRLLLPCVALHRLSPARQQKALCIQRTHHASLIPVIALSAESFKGRIWNACCAVSVQRRR